MKTQIKVKKNNKDCPIENVSWLFQDVYAVHIIKNLLENKKNRFSSLRGEIKNICDATLSKNLKTLEKEEIIEKEILKTFPPTTNYFLTKKGKDFSKVLKKIEDYSSKYKKVKKK